MGFINKIRGKIKGYRNALNQIDPSKGSRFLLLCDIIYCKYRFHTRIEEYIQYRFYDFSNRYRKNFLLKHHQWKAYRKINDFSFTQSKYGFYSRIPNSFQRKLILAPACGEDAFLAFFKEHKSVVIKPNKGSYGRGICLVKYESDEQIRKLFQELTGDTVCEEQIQQHPILSILNPFSVNSLRIVTLRHDEQNIEIISAALKSGSRPGSFIDNMHGGGIAAQVDIETGIVCTFGFDYAGNRYTRHPITHTQFIGLVLPNWDKVITLVKSAHSQITESKLIGWDVAITPTGADLIEANSAPGPRLMQNIDGIPKGEHVIPFLKNKKNHRKT